MLSNPPSFCTRAVQIFVLVPLWFKVSPELKEGLCANLLLGICPKSSVWETHMSPKTFRVDKSKQVKDGNLVLTRR